MLNDLLLNIETKTQTHFSPSLEGVGEANEDKANKIHETFGIGTTGP